MKVDTHKIWQKNELKRQLNKLKLNNSRKKQKKNKRIKVIKRYKDYMRGFDLDEDWGMTLSIFDNIEAHRTYNR